MHALFTVATASGCLSETDISAPSVKCLNKETTRAPSTILSTAATTTTVRTVSIKVVISHRCYTASVWVYACVYKHRPHIWVLIIELLQQTERFILHEKDLTSS